MSNVLPHEAQKVVWGMYRARFVVAGSLVGLAAAALSGLALLPTYLALQVGQRDSSPEISSRGSVDQADREGIIHTQSLLAALSPLLAATTTPTETIALALSLRPANVTVDHVSYTSGSPSTIMIVGSAAREAINAYRQALQSDPHWKSVSVPVGDLAGAVGGQFSVTLVLAKDL